MDSKKNTTSRYPAEFRELAVQMVIDHLDSYASLTAAVRDIAAKLGCWPIVPVCLEPSPWPGGAHSMVGEVRIFSA